MKTPHITYKALFRSLDPAEPPPDLSRRIIHAIEEHRRHKARVQLVSFGLVALAALVSIVPAFQHLLDSMNATSFGQYWSLLFTDSATVLASWKDFLSVLVESLPVLSIAAFLAVILAFVASIRMIAQNYKDALLRVA